MSFKKDIEPNPSYQGAAMQFYPLIVEGVLYGKHLDKPMIFNIKRPDKGLFDAIIVPDVETCLEISNVSMALARDQGWHDSGGDACEYSLPLRYSYWGTQWLFYAESRRQPYSRSNLTSFIPGQRVRLLVSFDVYRRSFPLICGVSAELHSIHRIEEPHVISRRDHVAQPLDPLARPLEPQEAAFRDAAD